VPGSTQQFGLILFRLEGIRRARNVSKWDENANGRLISMQDPPDDERKRLDGLLK
jgi:hypothetical protein